MPQGVQSVIFIEWYSFCEKKNDKMPVSWLTFLEKQIAVTSNESGSWVSVHILVYCFHTFSDHTRPSYGVFRETWQISHMSLHSFFFSILFQHQTCVLLNWRTAIVLWHECHSVCFSSFLSLLSRLYAVVYLGRKLSIWKEVWKTVFHR